MVISFPFFHFRRKWTQSHKRITREIKRVVEKIAPHLSPGIPRKFLNFSVVAKTAAIASAVVNVAVILNILFISFQNLYDLFLRMLGVTVIATESKCLVSDICCFI